MYVTPSARVGFGSNTANIRKQFLHYKIFFRFFLHFFICALINKYIRKWSFDIIFAPLVQKKSLQIILPNNLQRFFDCQYCENN